MHMTSLHLEDAPNFTLFGKYATKWRWSAVVDCARLLCLCILWVHIYVCDGISLQFHHIKWHLDLWLSEHFIESRINYVAEINKKIKHLGFLTHTHTNVLYTINQFSIRYLFVTNLELKENKNKTTINQTTHTHTAETKKMASCNEYANAESNWILQQHNSRKSASRIDRTLVTTTTTTTTNNDNDISFT